MSVISRMLRDLEARKAQPGAGSDPRTLKPAPVRGRGGKRRRDTGQRSVALTLAIVLVAVAAALWWQRAPDLRAGLGQAVGRVGALWGDGSSNPERGGQSTSALSQAEVEPEPEPQRLPTRLAAAHFTGTADEAALELRLQGELRGDPGYSRQGSAVSLRLSADAAGMDMPAPPADQRVFKSVTLQSNGDRGATIRLRVAEGARFDLASSAGGVTLSGHLPAAPEAGDRSQPQSSGSQQSDAAEAEAERVASASDGPSAQAEQTAQPSAANESSAAESDSAGTNAADTTETRSSQAASPSDAAAGGANDEGPAANPADASTPAAGNSGMRKEDRSSPAVRAERRYREARDALSTGDVGQARQQLRDALDLDPGLHRARDLLVALHRRAGQDDAAREVLAEGVAQAPGRLAYAKPYARLLVDAGDLERAAAVLADAAGSAGDDAQFHALSAAVAQRRGRHEAAASAYTRALELQADNGRWWLGLGVSLAASGHPGEAAAAFREARRTGSLGQRLDGWARSRIQALEGGSG